MTRFREESSKKIVKSAEVTRRALAVFGLPDKLVTASLRRVVKGTNQRAEPVALTDPNGVLLSDFCASFNQFRRRAARDGYDHARDALIFNQQDNGLIGIVFWMGMEMENPQAGCFIARPMQPAREPLGWLVATCDLLPSIPPKSWLDEVASQIETDPRMSSLNAAGMAAVLGEKFSYKGRPLMPPVPHLHQFAAAQIKHWERTHPGA